ncbi:hypothetical protein GE061_000930 [Apolygus lucorum]|uniref:Uncharacterized protein n=1 Tax=Apolygus lucorum TaxID=248454 RepID=A0A8S9Y5Q2_APOLU|nr:hypothetical protein GE061_000930 [Apolygus lucorum]
MSHSPSGTTMKLSNNPHTGSSPAKKHGRRLKSFKITPADHNLVEKGGAYASHIEKHVKPPRIRSKHRRGMVNVNAKQSPIASNLLQGILRNGKWRPDTGSSPAKKHGRRLKSFKITPADHNLVEEGGAHTSPTEKHMKPPHVQSKHRNGMVNVNAKQSPIASNLLQGILRNGKWRPDTDSSPAKKHGRTLKSFKITPADHNLVEEDGAYTSPIEKHMKPPHIQGNHRSEIININPKQSPIASKSLRGILRNECIDESSVNRWPVVGGKRGAEGIPDPQD